VLSLPKKKKKVEENYMLMFAISIIDLGSFRFIGIFLSPLAPGAKLKQEMVRERL
jgi:hypothetical protein